VYIAEAKLENVYVCVFGSLSFMYKLYTHTCVHAKGFNGGNKTADSLEDITSYNP